MICDFIEMLLEDFMQWNRKRRNKYAKANFYEFKLKKWFLSKGLLNNNFDYKKRYEEVLDKEKELGSNNTTALLPSSEKYSRNEIWK